MAQQDTGLGWSAEANWLVNVTGEIANYSTFGGSSFPDQPIPQTGAGYGDFANIWASGLTIGTNSSTGRILKIGSSPYAPVIAALDSTTSGNSRRGMWAVCPISSVDLPTANARVISFNSSGSTYSNASITTASRDTTTGLYYTYITLPDSMTQYLILPEYPSLSALLADIEIVTASFEKENAGYAVACAVKWKTSNGTELVSPILISSNTEFVDMTTTGTGNHMAKFNKLLSGVRFYMAFWDIDGNTDLVTALQRIDLTGRGNMDLEQLFMTIISTSYAHVIIINSPDPYEKQTGSSGEEGGNGEEIVDDDVDFTPLPSSMAVASGFITLFCPSQYELNRLANYMWSPAFDVDTFKKLFANPMDCILGLAVYPFPISASGTKTVSVGGISTTVSMGYTLQQYHIVDCGSVYVPKQWGAYMDYAPYTRFNIFLPYIGFRSVSADDIMGKTISLRYMVDILSGACNAELKCGSTVLYSWAGSCAAQIPITGNDWRSAITSGISIAGSVAATVLTQGASAPMIAGTVASATVNSMQLKPEVQRSGSISGSSGFLAGQRPYLVRTNPRSAIPANQNKYSGYPSFVTILLGSLTGYNEVYSVHLENIPATGAELDEIESILKGGAIF